MVFMKLNFSQFFLVKHFFVITKHCLSSPPEDIMLYMYCDFTPRPAQLLAFAPGKEQAAGVWET